MRLTPLVFLLWLSACASAHSEDPRWTEGADSPFITPAPDYLTWWDREGFVQFAYYAHKDPSELDKPALSCVTRVLYENLSREDKMWFDRAARQEAYMRNSDITDAYRRNARQNAVNTIKTVCGEKAMQQLAIEQ